MSKKIIPTNYRVKFLVKPSPSNPGSFNHLNMDFYTVDGEFSEFLFNMHWQQNKPNDWGWYALVVDKWFDSIRDMQRAMAIIKRLVSPRWGEYNVTSLPHDVIARMKKLGVDVVIDPASENLI